MGHSSFLLRSKKARVVIDPFDPKMVGLPYLSQKADLVLVTHHHHDHDYVEKIKGDPLVIDLPGEFEKNGVRVFGYRTFHDKEGGKLRGENVIYKLETEKINILHLGDIGHTLEPSLVEKLDRVDILMVPVGGVYTIGPQDAVKIVNQLEPKIILPMHYYRKELNQKTFGELHPLSDFLREMGVDEAATESKLVVKKDSLPEERSVIVLSI